MTVSADFFTSRALSGRIIQDIGQVSPNAKRALDKLVRTGKLTRVRSSWMNISPWKMTWCLPCQVVNVGNRQAVYDYDGALYAMKQAA